MRHLYDTQSVLQTESKAFLEVNYNRTVFSMADPGEVLYYQAPDDPAEHPMYVDAEGRNVPVSSSTLQPMTNANGNIVDKNGNLVPKYEFDPAGKMVHKDDVRVAVVSSDFEVKDEEGNDILIAHDGEIIPTDDNGVPGTVLVDGVVWVRGKDGLPHAPLDRVYPLRSYARPVRAENRPVTRTGALAPLVEDEYPDYFDISHIVRANRPSKRGVLYAWAAEHDSGSPVIAGPLDYRKPRFYPASKDGPYKYWTAPNTSDPVAVLSGSSVTVFDSSWRVNNGLNFVAGGGMISADFPPRPLTSDAEYFEKVIQLDDTTGYDISFSAVAQSSAMVQVELLEWSDIQPATPDTRAGSFMGRNILGSRRVPVGMAVEFNMHVVPSAGSRSHVLRFTIKRMGTISGRKVSLMNLVFKRAVFPIAGVGPRAVYDRPLNTNKIVIGLDYSLDERTGMTSDINRPGDYIVRIYRDRGDGLFVWQTVSDTPTIDDDGRIVLNYNGSSWGATAPTEATVPLMGVQLVVLGMKRRDARVNVIEISARRRYDVSDLIMSYDYETSASDDSFVLPFGSVSSNSGSLDLSNHDGRFNPNNRFLLNQGGTDPGGSDSFTDIPNPFYQVLNDTVEVEIDTATFVPGAAEKDFVRMVTAKTTGGVNAGSSMTASLDLSDDSRLLEKTDVPPRFYYGTTVSVVETMFMLLDAIGFTNVKFSYEDDHFSTHMKYFWTKKDSDNVWSVIADVCRSTQTVAYFDEHNVLNFKSLRGLYEDALAKAPAWTFTSEDYPGVKSNIMSMELDSTVSVNKVNLNYRETTEPEKTPSGDTPMTVVWEPEGTQVIRAGHLREDLGDKQVGYPAASRFLTLSPGSTQTWPYTGMVSVEGEFIRYEGKQYRYHRADGSVATKMLKNEDDRKQLDKLNEFLAHKNSWSGKLGIAERGAENTVIKWHRKGELKDFYCRFKQGGAVRTDYRKGLSIQGGRLHVVGQTGVKSHGVTTITRGSINDNRPTHMGTRFRIGSGQGAGVCFGMANSEDGIFVEVFSTESTEALGRPRGELHVYARHNGQIKFHGFGTNVPISRHKDYDLDVTIQQGTRKLVTHDHSLFYEIQLKFGDRGNNVTYLQTALNDHNERLVVDGIFGSATRNAVKRLQKRRYLARDGVVNIEEWEALEKGQYDGNYLTVYATIDGNYALTTAIPLADLPIERNGGRFGLFTRGKTSASFEYLYALRGREDIDFDLSGYFDYVKGGFVSDQLDAGMIYNTKRKWVGQREVTYITDQLYMHDFGPIAHEIRDYEVTFKDDNPAISSFPFFSNTSQVLLMDYVHGVFGAKMRMVNKSRNDAVLNGEDSYTYGTDNTVNQRFMIYGTTLNIEDERSLTVSNRSAISASGVEELTIDADWIQSEESANKLGSHIVEAMSNSVSTYNLDIFGNAAVRVGQTVEIYNPQQGVGSNATLDGARAVPPGTLNRYFVHGVSHSNDGTHSTRLSVREVIGSDGLRNVTLRDVVASNNNAMNLNADMKEYIYIDRNYLPEGYDFNRTGLKARYTTALYGGGGGVRMEGSGSTPYNTAMLLNPYPDGVGRFGYPYGEHFLFTVNVTAVTDAAVGIAVEGWPTTGGMTKVISSKAVTLSAGQTKDIVLKGRFMTDPNIPEMELSVRALSHENVSNGAKAGEVFVVNSTFFRASQSEDDIYPLHGGGKFKNS